MLVYIRINQPIDVQRRFIIMSDSCFGLCSIRGGVTYIYVFNIFWITLRMMVDYMNRLSFYDQIYKDDTLNSEQDRNETYNNSTSNEFKHSYYFLSPLMSDVFMDYILIIHLGWCTMEFYLNISLKQSTYKRVYLEKIYAWLVIYYANLIESIAILSNLIVTNSVFMDRAEYVLYFFKIIIIGIEIYIVRIHYDQQKLVVAGNCVRLEWKYVPKTKMQSERITATRTETTAEDESNYIPIFVKNMRNPSS